MRLCPRCGSGLRQGDGFEVSAMDRGGNPLEVDEFQCLGCGHLFRHSYEERFTGDIENWWSRAREADPWEILARDGWPTFGQGVAPATAATTQASVPARPVVPLVHEPRGTPEFDIEEFGSPLSVIYLPHFNHQAVLVYDRETGLHEEISLEAFPADARFWRGFYLPSEEGCLGVYASPDGPVFFNDLERTLTLLSTTRGEVIPSGKQRLFRLEHEGQELARILYDPPPSGFDAWSQDEAMVDFYTWLARGTGDPQWYTYHTARAGEDVTWRPSPPEPDPGPHFGEYVLVWDSERDQFPECLRLLGPGELPLDYPDRDLWTGSVSLAQRDDLITRLRDRFPQPRYLTLTMYGDDVTMAKKKFREIFARS